MDGLCNLTQAEKEARDKRARDWMNQRKIEQVHRASTKDITKKDVARIYDVPLSMLEDRP